MRVQALVCGFFSVSTAGILNQWKDFTELVRTVNEANAGWTAQNPSRFESTAHAASLCGTILKGDPRYVSSDIPLWDEPPLPLEHLPETFDTRAAHPNCTVIGKVNDQASCGSCWAFSATQTVESVMCIAGKGDVELSKEDTAQCCKGAMCGYSLGCQAGTPSAAMRWIQFDGVVTGGSYNSSVGCKPYSLPPCNVDPTNHKNPLPICHEPKPPPTLTCSTQCNNSHYNISYNKDKEGVNHNARIVGLNYRDDNNTHIMSFMMQNGPVSATFTVMEDFPAYRGGVYRHIAGSALGGHAIMIVGWGVDKSDQIDLPYWLVKNSWSAYWGEEGYFRIYRGVDEVGIESDVNGYQWGS